VVTLLAGPLLLTFAASLALVYPFGGRVGLAIVPGMAMLIGAGATALTHRTAPKWRTGAALGLAAPVLLMPAVGSAWLAVLGGSPEEPRQIVHEFLRRALPNEPVYVFVRGVPNWLMYTTNWSAPDTARALRLVRAATRLGPNSGNAPARGRPVVHEGDELRFMYGERIELLGLPTGVEDIATPPSRFTPDPGWAENETRRIVAEAHPSVWVVLLHHRPAVTGHLLTALCAAGARISYTSIRPGAALYRMEFRNAQQPRDGSDGMDGPCR
jgi:hypothetical protein